jgi:excisionase family DNA binding protein
MNTQSPEQTQTTGKFLLSLNETATFLGRNRSHIYKLLAEEGLPGIRMRHRWVFRQADLIAWVEARPCVNRLGR